MKVKVTTNNAPTEFICEYVEIVNQDEKEVELMVNTIVSVIDKLNLNGEKWSEYLQLEVSVSELGFGFLTEVGDKLDDIYRVEW